MKMAMPVDVIASFNKKGNIKALYISMSDTDGMRQTYKVFQYWDMTQGRTEHIKFECEIEMNSLLVKICLFYNIRDHLWSLMKN